MKPPNRVNPSPEDISLHESTAFQRLRKLWSDFAPFARGELVLQVFNEGHSTRTMARNLGKHESTIRRDIAIGQLPDAYKERIWNGENTSNVLRDFRRSETNNKVDGPVVSNRCSSSSSPTGSAPKLQDTVADRPDFMERVLQSVRQQMAEYARNDRLTAEAMRDPKYRK